MHNRQTPLHWSFPCGTWAGTDVRVSFLMPLLVVLICWRLGDLQLGLAVSLVFVASVLIHEAAHIFAVRATGGTGDEILLWPLGGLAAVHPAETFRSQFLTPAAGPLSNLLLCLFVALPVLQSPYATSVFYPFELPVAGFTNEPVQDILAVTFWMNWILLLINLIPVYPLDGGRMLLAVLSTRWPSGRANEIYLHIGLLLGIVAFIGGMFGDSVWVVALAAMVLILNLQEWFMLQVPEPYEDNFLGYDFSQGYTSLERDAEEKKPEKRPGFLQRWREKRRAEKERREREREAEVQAEVDRLLQKIKDEGMESLTEAERRELKRASALFKHKGNSAK